jgi:hypothetical protein
LNALWRLPERRRGGCGRMAEGGGGRSEVLDGAWFVCLGASTSETLCYPYRKRTRPGSLRRAPRAFPWCCAARRRSASRAPWSTWRVSRRPS